MRLLFNHGLSISELYTNTPESITNKKWTWFIKRYGSSSSRSAAISDPFKYALVLIFNKILDDKIRFKIPVKLDAYIDFEVVNEDDFIDQRKLGRFKDVDFVNSDFTGYAVRYFYKGKAYSKSNQVYFGGDLKKKFLEKINSGELFYSVKDFTIDDIIDDVYEKFPELNNKEVKNIVLHGFRRMHYAIKYGCSITLNTTRYGNCYAHIGGISLNPEKQMKTYNLQKDRKLRRIEMWKRPDFDGYYYIGLNPERFQEWLELNKVSRTLVKFEHVSPRKIMEEFFYKHKEVHIFRIKLKKFKGWIHKKEKIISRDITYMGKSLDWKFIPSNMSWKQLIKEYETGIN